LFWKNQVFRYYIWSCSVADRYIEMGVLQPRFCVFLKMQVGNLVDENMLIYVNKKILHILANQVFMRFKMSRP
jgi:hypothetical protein